MKYIRDIVIIIILFMFFSLSNLYSYDNSLFIKQLIWYVIGFSIIGINNKRFNIKFIFILYIITNGLLLYLLLYGSSINGSRAWLSVFGFSIQPSEFMKIILILLLSYISVSNNKFILKCIILTLIPSVLTFLEPDTGNVIFYIIILISVISSRVNILKYSYLPIIFIIAFFYLYYFQMDLFINLFGSSFFYRLDRFTNLSSSYQLNMALIGISSSGLFGIKDFVSVPEVTTDFMFTLNIMNNGFIGILIYLIINILFNICFIKLFNKSIGVSKEIIKSFLVMKISQEVIHIGMNVGFLPITGITLPFISYGGSSLISYFIIISFIINSYKDSRMDSN